MSDKMFCVPRKPFEKFGYGIYQTIPFVWIGQVIFFIYTIITDTFRSLIGIDLFMIGSFVFAVSLAMFIANPIPEIIEKQKFIGWCDD